MRVKIAEMRTAFDKVIPGYADAWNTAKIAAAGGPLSRRRLRWDGPRKYLRMDGERCLLLYTVLRAVDVPESYDVPSDPETMLVQNRGYVSLMVVRFADQQEAARALYAMRDPAVELNDRRHARRSDKPYEPDLDSFWWTYDGTDFDERCKITLRVLQYVHENSTSIDPVWKHQSAADLIGES